MGRTTGVQFPEVAMMGVSLRYRVQTDCGAHPAASYPLGFGGKGADVLS
jgi:hypothetical protein